MDCGDLSLEVAGVFVLFVSVEWSDSRVVSEGRRAQDVCGFLSHGLQTRRPCVALNIILTRADVLADSRVTISLSRAVSFAKGRARGTDGAHINIAGLVSSGSVPQNVVLGESQNQPWKVLRERFWHAHRGPT